MRPSFLLRFGNQRLKPLSLAPCHTTLNLHSACFLRLMRKHKYWTRGYLVVIRALRSVRFHRTHRWRLGGCNPLLSSLSTGTFSNGLSTAHQWWRQRLQQIVGNSGCRSDKAISSYFASGEWCIGGLWLVAKGVDADTCRGSTDAKPGEAALFRAARKSRSVPVDSAINDLALSKVVPGLHAPGVASIEHGALNKHAVFVCSSACLASVVLYLSIMVTSMLRRNPCLRMLEVCTYFNTFTMSGRIVDGGCDGASNEKKKSQLFGPDAAQPFDTVATEDVK